MDAAHPRDGEKRGGASALRRVRTYAVVLLVLLWGASAVNYATHGPVARNGHIKGGDYAHFYMIGRLAAARDSRGLYSPIVQRREFGRAVPDVEAPRYLPVYGPQVALALAPLGRLPYVASLIIWWLLATLTYVLTSLAVWQRCGHPKAGRGDFLLFAMAFPGFWEVFINGQTTWLALTFFTAFWLSLRSGKSILAGVSVGLLLYKPQLGLAVLIVLLATRRWQILSTAAAVVVIQAAICWLWFGGDVLIQYGSVLRSLPNNAALLEPNPFESCSLRGFFMLLGMPAPWSTLAYVLSSSGVCVWLVRIWRTTDLDTAFAVLLISTILIAPHATLYDLVLIAPALALLANANARESTNKALWPVLYLAYLAPLSGAFVAVIHVQLVAPILLTLARVAQAGSPPRVGRPAPVS